MNKKIVAFAFVAAIAALFLVLPALAAVTTYYDMTVTVRNNTQQENALTADSIKVYYPSGTLAVDAKGNSAMCTACHEKTFNLSSGDYIIEAIKAHYIPKNISRTLDASSHYIIKLTADNVAPTTTISLSPSANADGWYNSDVTVTLSATDNDGGAGVKNTRYSTNGAMWPIYTAPFKITTEGTTNLQYKSEDWAQNVETAQSATIKLDKTAPVINTLTAKTDANGNAITASTWQSDATPYFSWTFIEAGSGIAGYSFAMDANADDTVDTANAFYQYDTALTDGKHDFHVKAKDVAGNWGAELTFSIWMDTVTPQIGGITAYTDANKNTAIANNVWQTDGTPYFVWTDPSSLSDDTFYYTTDGTEPTQASNSLNAAVYDRTAQAFAEGTATLKVKAQSGAGLWSDTKGFVLKYDGTAPATTLAFAPANPDGQNNWYISDITVTLSCSDGNGVVSGCAQTKYTLDGTTWNTYTAPFKIAADGSNIAVQYYTVDNAGNTETTQTSAAVKLDRIAPVFSNEVNPGTKTYVQNANYAFSMDWADVTSGISTVTFTFDGTDYAPSVSGSTYTQTMSDLPAGTYKYKWVANDSAGNTRTTGEYTFVITRATPAMSLTFSPSASETYGTQTTATCSLTAGDAGNNVKLYRNGAAVQIGPNTVSDVQTLAAGNYDYYCEYIESQNFTVLTTAVNTLTISKAAVDVRLWLNGAEADAQQTYGTGSNATATIDVSGLTFGLTRNGQQMASGTDILSDVGTLAAGVYTYVASFAGNENYTADSATFKLTVDKAVPTIKLYLDGAEWTADSIKTYPTATDVNATIDVVGLQSFVVLSRNTVAVSNPDAGTLDVLAYQYAAAFAGNENYTSASTAVRTLTVNQAANPITLTLNGQSSNIVITYGTTVKAVGTLVAGTLKLERDGVDVTSELNQDILLNAGVYTYKLTAVGNQNYKSNSTGVTYTVTVSKVPSSMTLLFDGAAGNTTIERGNTVNITAMLNVSDTVHLFLDDVEVDSGTQTVQFDYATGSVTLTKHKVKAVAYETANQFGAEKTYYITVQDTVAPVITVTNPVNDTTIETNKLTVAMTSNEDLSGATISLDGGTAVAMSGLGTGWTFDLTNLGQNTQHYIIIKGTDKASLSTTTDKVYFTVPYLSHLVRTTIDNQYYADDYLNIHGTSTIVRATITDSTVDHSTIMDSTVSGKHISHMTIKNSNVDPADFTGSDIEDSTVTENDDNYIKYSNVTNSTITYTDLDTCDVTLSTIEYSSLKNMKVGNANISHNYLYTGWLYYNGVNYTMPTDLANLQTGSDGTAPVIDPLTVSNSTPAPGDTVTFTAIAKDNVAVKTVEFNGTAMTFAGGYSYTWTYDLAIPAANGTFVYFVKATDYAGNSRDRKVTIVVDTSATPQVTITIDPVPCEVLGNCPAPATPPSGGGGGTGNFYIITPLTAEMTIDAPASIDMKAGESKMMTMVIKNAGTGSLTNIGIDATGLPATWLVFSSRVTEIPKDGSVTNSITITVPANEPSGTRTLTITVTTAEGKTVSRSVALIIAGVPTPQNQTTVTPPVPPSGLTGAILAITSNPSAVGLIVAAIIVGGAVFLTKKPLFTRKAKPEKAEKAEKTERKFI